LDIRHQNAHPNGSSITYSLLPVNSFHAAVQHAGAAVIAEFGDTMFNESFTKYQSSRDSIEQETCHQPQVSEAAVDLGEFPWALGEIRQLERAEVHN
jgi:hypothetical protein